ncbi:MAG: hypothetical protein Q8L49_04785 [Burkholderiaceae bacterium]|nr:hypothetical protein [Burkholderiaceae bacterium]
MKTTQPQMILVAVLVCLFAVGMAGLLNFFKYRSYAERMLNERLAVTGSAIENAIQSSMALGLQFSDLGTLPGTLERERATDDLILSIEVFDIEGKPLYSTDRLRAARNVPTAWLDAARNAKGADWFVRNGADSASGVAIKNNFGLPIGYLALRYSEEQVSDSHNAVARELALSTAAVFVVAATLASLALLAVMRRLSRDLEAVEAALRSADPVRPSALVRNGPFGRALRQFFERVRGAEAEIALLRRDLERGVGR